MADSGPVLTPCTVCQRDLLLGVCRAPWVGRVPFFSLRGGGYAIKSTLQQGVMSDFIAFMGGSPSSLLAAPCALGEVQDNWEFT